MTGVILDHGPGSWTCRCSVYHFPVYVETFPSLIVFSLPAANVVLMVPAFHCHVYCTLWYQQRVCVGCVNKDSTDHYWHMMGLQGVIEFSTQPCQQADRLHNRILLHYVGGGILAFPAVTAAPHPPTLSAWPSSRTAGEVTDLWRKLSSDWWFPAAFSEFCWATQTLQPLSLHNKRPCRHGKVVRTQKRCLFKVWGSNSFFVLRRLDLLSKSSFKNTVLISPNLSCFFFLSALLNENYGWAQQHG